jgi:PhnB protein
MTKAKNPIPNGLHSITPNLIVKGATKAIDFYKKAFGATEINRMAGPNGLIMHAALSIGDSRFFLNDEMTGQQSCPSPSTLGGTAVVMNLFVPDCDKIYQQAVAAGAKATMPLADQFWGDRYGQVTDPYGHIWAIATHKEDLTPAEMEERGRQFMASVPQR